MEKFDQNSLNDLLSQATNVRKRSCLQPIVPNADAWLTTPPIAAPGLHREAERFQSCVKYRLGIPMYDDPQNDPYCKNGVVNIYGNHFLTCAGRGDNIHLHDRLCDKMFSSCVSAS